MAKTVTFPVTNRKKTDMGGRGFNDVSGKRSEPRVVSAGRFIRGASGNPAGRPRGSLNKSHERLRAILAVDAEGVLQRVILSALDGDMLAARIILDRALPRRVCRPPMGIDFLVLKTVTDAPGMLAEILDAATAGRISTSEATDMAKIVELFTGSIVVGEMTARIERLEAQLREPGR